jgi:two-component system NtrC family sensor kinase
MPGILATVVNEFDGTQATCWLRGIDGLRRAWSVGNDETTPGAVEAYVRTHEPVDADDFHAVKLRAANQELGALSVRPGRALNAQDQLFFSTVADLLAPALDAAENAHRLESEVAARTRQFDQQRRFIEKIIDSLPVGLYVIDRGYRIQAWNRKRETGLQGVSREEAIGRTIFEILHRQPAELLRSEFESVFETGQMQQFTIESSSFGEPRTYRISKIPMSLVDEKEVSHIITIGEDITEWKSAEARFAQAEKLAAIGTLAAGVMHEINNPLATIGACAETLVLGIDEDTLEVPRDKAEVKESLSLIEHEVMRCKGIIDGLLDFSRPKQTTKAPVDLNFVIEKTLKLVKHHPRFRRVTVGVEKGDLRAIWANEEQMIQVFMALLLNALDAIEDKGEITLRTRMNETADTAVAEVVDRGQGIRPADQKKIFEPFFTTKAPSRGTGLGLSIVYAIVTEHGGRIEVDSAPGEGSIFRILLPANSTK